ncbi:hypothetical protein FOJ82_15380 [Tessaracoccus rhinocerotis]|uniref:Beta-galactosidase trimerisation domain-containing protein n=1 Tax=Tessaracoccus rhinocerotis TaxID=1689449 RepID=A0A553JWA3_9ACTN|nr:hypothetical protein [Tessaracoccus rhinocerotis]TRY16761.1 hypothetical protein FOJ82_15380 [Tessaracoccus rhinocerotis]
MTRSLRRANLETSLKPFESFTDAAVAATVGRVFDQWRTLLEAAEECSLLLWASDGSEILDWSGDLDQEFEWARFIGFNNVEHGPYGEEKEPERVALPYRRDAPRVTYRDLAKVVAAFRAEGTARGIPTQVGATFDPGPEFAPSSFKFERHPEVVARGEDVGIGPIIAMVRHFSELRADDRRYAGFPDGIPDGTSFGEFLGRQSRDFLDRLGFDYLWLSNGFGFSSYAWSELGESFDGVRFRAERSGELRRRALDFWRDLSAHLDHPVQVRGTNHTAGIDIGADSVPALEIYEGGHISSPPPNSPWGPLNEDFGIELSGFMSRIALLPAGCDGYRMRFYANDPWFWQQPWWDFYHREPFDIHLPFAVSRVRADGTVQPPTEVNILAIDTAHGVLDERCAREVGTHIMVSLESMPDAAGPLVWVYPFREYHEAMASDPASIGTPHFEDWFLTSAINAGLPLNTVVPTDDAAAAVASGALDGRVLVVPAGGIGAALAGVLADHANRGGTVLVYGSMTHADDCCRELVGLGVAEVGLDGDLQFRTELAGDVVPGAEMPLVLRHTAHLSGGSVTEVLPAAGDGVRPLATVSRGGVERVFAASRAVGDGRVLWVRGSAPFEYSEPDGRGVRTHVPHDRSVLADAGALARDLIAEAGLRVSHELRTAASGRAVQAIHRHDGAFWFSGYLPDTTTRIRLRLPQGAPLLQHTECWLGADGATVHQLPKSFHLECRVLVEQATPGMLRCREVAPFPAHMTRGTRVSGLVDATVRLLLPAELGDVRIDVDGVPRPESFEGAPGDQRPREVVVPGVTGTLTVMWQEH